MIIETRAVEPFYKNGYVVGCEETREAVVIDPGDEVDLLVDAVREHGLSVRYILLTHAHLDHITGVKEAKEAFGVPVGLHKDDLFLYDAVVEQGRAFGFRVERQPKIDFFYEGEGPWRFGRQAMWVYHTPGHCPGGVCLAAGGDGDPARTLFVGDTLFAGSIGRTDLPGGSHAQLMASMAEKILPLDDGIRVLPGHGDTTTIGAERATNPFLLELLRSKG